MLFYGTGRAELVFPTEEGCFSETCTLAILQKVKKKFEENHVKVLDLPENLWSIVKSRLLKRDCTTKTKLIDAIIYDLKLMI